MKLYLAGPLFTAAERMFNVHLADELKKYGYEVFVPQEHEPREKTPRAIFNQDLLGLLRSDVIVANLDGPDPDSGTAFEMGYGYALGKRIVSFRTDFRGADDGSSPVNLMLTGSSNYVAISCLTYTVTELGATINAVLRQL